MAKRRMTICIDYDTQYTQEHNLLRQLELGLADSGFLDEFNCTNFDISTDDVKDDVEPNTFEDYVEPSTNDQILEAVEEQLQTNRTIEHE